jgi:Holliday junction DNA helicase RuvA
MIAQLTGKFLYKTPTQLVIDCNGVGYEVNISLHTFSAIQHLDFGTLFTFLKVAEDAHTLYGFSEIAEKQIFIMLLSVSGVGSATARMMLSSLKPLEVQQAILTGNLKLLESIKGIGKKTAERIVLELRDKVGKQTTIVATSSPSYNTTHNDALEALVALGINRILAEQAIKKVPNQAVGTMSVEELIKQVLKSI